MNSRAHDFRLHKIQEPLHISPQNRIRGNLIVTPTSKVISCCFWDRKFILVVTRALLSPFAARRSHSTFSHRVKVSYCLCVISHHTIRAYFGAGLAPCLLYVSFTPRQSFPTLEGLLYPFDRRLCGSHKRYASLGEEKKVLFLSGIETFLRGRLLVA